MWSSLLNQSPVDGQFDYFDFLLLPKAILSVRSLDGDLGNMLQISRGNEADFYILQLTIYLALSLSLWNFVSEVEWS